MAVLAGGIAAQAAYAGEAPTPQTVVDIPASLNGASYSYDLAGYWYVVNSEEVNARALGGVYDVRAGIPLNPSALARAESFSEEESSIPEFQCRRFITPVNFRNASIRLHITDKYGVVSNQKQLTEDKLIGYVVQWMSREAEIGATRVLYIDGRPAPSPLAPHSFAGFSTGKWVGNVLYIQQSHLKTYYHVRPGIMASDRTTVIEHWIRHGNLLTQVQETHDPVYLTEPYVKSNQFAYSAGPLPPEPIPVCVGNTPELPSLTDHGHHVPFFAPGANPADQEVVRKYGVPLDVARGTDGAAMMYPEYRKRMTQHASSLPHCEHECNAVGNRLPRDAGL